MTNGTNPAPQQGFGQGWPQPAQKGPVFDQNHFGGSRPFQQAEGTHASQITTDEADNIAAQRGEKVQKTDRRRSRIWSNILGVIALALLIAALVILAWTYLPSPPIDATTAQAENAETLTGSLGGLKAQGLEYGGAHGHA